MLACICQKTALNRYSLLAVIRRHFPVNIFYGKIVDAQKKHNKCDLCFFCKIFFQYILYFSPPPLTILFLFVEKTKYHKYYCLDYVSQLSNLSAVYLVFTKCHYFFVISTPEYPNQNPLSTVICTEKLQ